MKTKDGSDLNGFVTTRGDAAKLDKVRKEDAFRNLAIEAKFCLEKFGVIDGYMGDGISEIFSLWSTHFS